MKVKIKIRKGDKVIVTVGKSKGTVGEVLKCCLVKIRLWLEVLIWLKDIQNLLKTQLVVL